MKFCRESAVFNISEYHPNTLSPVVAAHLITACTAVLFNLLIIVSVSKSRSIQTPSRILLCSLSLTDLCLGLIAQPATAFFYISAFEDWEECFCFSRLVMTRAGYAFGIISFMNLTAMSVDRCLAVVMLEKYKHAVTKRRTIATSVAIWTTGAVATLLCVELYPSRKLTVAVTTGSLLITTMIVSFLLAYLSLKKITNTVFDSSNQSDFNVSKYKHSLTTMILILGLNLVVYLPIVVYIVIEQVSEISRYNSLIIYQYNGVLLAMNSTINPLFYIWRMRDLRNAVRRLVSI